MMPKKKLLEQFHASGDDRTAKRQLGAAYMLTSAAYLLASDFDDLLRKHGLELGEIRRALGRLMKDFDRVGPLVSPMIQGANCRSAYWADLDGLRSLVDRWVGRSVPNSSERLEEAAEAAKQYLNDNFNHNA